MRCFPRNLEMKPLIPGPAEAGGGGTTILDLGGSVALMSAGLPGALNLEGSYSTVWEDIGDFVRAPRAGEWTSSVSGEGCFARRDPRSFLKIFDVPEL